MEDPDLDLEALDKAWVEFDSRQRPRLVCLAFDSLKRLCDLVAESPDAQARVNPNHLWDVTCWVLDVALGEEQFEHALLPPRVARLVRLGQELQAQTGIEGESVLFPDELLESLEFLTTK
jgi:hypothetical protein